MKKQKSKSWSMAYCGMAAALWQQLQQSPGLPVPPPATPDTGEAG